MLKLLIRRGVCLSGLPGIPLSLKRLVVFRDILFSILTHFMLDHIILLFGVTCNSSDHNTNSSTYYACYAQPDFASIQHCVSK